MLCKISRVVYGGLNVMGRHWRPITRLGIKGFISHNYTPYFEACHSRHFH